jgi:hypothetical protein
MKLRLFNLTDNAILFKSDCARNDSEIIVLPEASAAIPSGKRKFLMSSVGKSQASTPEKVFFDYEVERQYVVNLSSSSSSRRSLLTLPEDCPWRIYRDQVASLTLL